MSEPPLASIIISSYNYARFLGEAIESALGQTWSHTEVVVVDDGSTDCSRDLIGGYGDRVISVLKENGGMASTQNAGFAACRGAVVLFLDADDLLLPTAVESAVELFADDRVVRVQWRMWEVAAEGRTTGRVVPANAPAEGDLRDLLIREGPDACVGPPTSGNAWSRAFLGQVLPIPEHSFRQHSDTYLMTLAPLHGTFRSVPAPQGCYRVHGENDFACRPVDEKNRRNLEMYDRRCLILSEYMGRLGIAADPERWKQGAGYTWMRRCQEATEAIKAIVPEGQSFILVDEQQWSDRGGHGAVISGRRAIPFLERDGRYWGRPPDGPTAISELERLRRSGVVCVAFAWPAFWWLDYYHELSEHLYSRFPCVLRDENLVVFDLRR
jgi:glycosyl transferase family 2